MGTAAGIFPQHSWTHFYAIGAITFVAFPIVSYVGKKLNYSRTEYRFYDDRLEFDEGFFSINRKVIKFRDIKETTQREGVLAAHLRPRLDLPRDLGDRLDHE